MAHSSTQTLPELSGLSRADPGPWRPLHCCRNTRGSVAWLHGHEMKDACVRALCNAPVKASANPDTLVTETQPRINIKVPALVQQLGAKSSLLSSTADVVLNFPSAGLGELKPKLVLSGFCCLSHSSLCCCPGHSQGSLPGLDTWSHSLCSRKNRQWDCEAT